MSAASAIRRFVAAAAVLTLATTAWPGPRDPAVVQQGFDFDNPQNPAQAEPDERPPGNDPTSYERGGDAGGWNVGGKHQGTQGVTQSGQSEDQSGWISLTIDNKYQTFVKKVVIEYDALEVSGGKVSAALTLDCDNHKSKAANNPTKLGPGAGGYPWTRYRCVCWIYPQPEEEELIFSFSTEANNDAGQALVDNVDVVTICLNETQLRGYAYGYAFGSDTWPPDPYLEDREDWSTGTVWDAYGGHPPEWMPALTDHEGVIGLPGGVDPMDGVLSVQCDDLFEPGGVQRVACQYCCYTAEGGLVTCEIETPPGTIIENIKEHAEDRGDGWERRWVTFDATPPPDWERYNFVMTSAPGGGPVAVDDVIVSAAPPFAAGWRDGFDAYENGSGMHGQGAWKGWDNDPAFDAYVTDAQADSGLFSVDIADSADLVHPITDADSGKWVFSAWQYIPGEFTSGSGPLEPGTYFMLLNSYTDGGPYNWSVQMDFDSNDGMLKVYYGNGYNTVNVPYDTDRWVKLQAVIDLDEDWTQIYYDDELVTEYSWTGGIYGDGTGLSDIAAVALCANGSSSVYYEDVTLVPDPDIELTYEVEQNGAAGRITAWICPGAGAEFSVDDPTSDDPAVIDVFPVSRGTTTLDGETCGQMITSFTRFGPGIATITLPAGEGETYRVDKVPFEVGERLFSVSVPGGAGFGEVSTSFIPPGKAVTCTIVAIDTITGEPDPAANGLATLALYYSDALTFDSGGQWQEIEFVGGLAEVTIHSDGPSGELGYLEVVDNDAPESVGGPLVVSTARVGLASDWSENFEPYPLGSNVHGQGGWKGWDNDPTLGAFVTDVVSDSEPHAVEIAGGSDLVHEFSQVDSGRWAMATWVYVPGDFQSGGEPPFAGSYFVMMNTYVDGGPHEESDWSVQMDFDSNDGMLKVYYGDGLNTVNVPYVPDEWIEINIKIDLDIDSCTISYDGQFVTEYSWTGGVLGGGGGALNVAAIDFCANGSSPIYYDDLRLQAAQLTGDMNCDGNVNAYDIDGFICALSAQCDYEGMYPDCDRLLADCNGDGVANAYDIDRFIEIVGGG